MIRYDPMLVGFKPNKHFFTRQFTQNNSIVPRYK